MKNVYLQLACNILSKNQNPSYKGHLYIVVILSIFPRFYCIKCNNFGNSTYIYVAFIPDLIVSFKMMHLRWEADIVSLCFTNSHQAC